MTTSHRTAALAFALAAAVSARASSQIPDKFENLQALPKDISKDSLTQIMRGFSFALGVRCQFCHAGGDGVSFAGVVFKSDEKPAKQNARFMLRMVDSVNRILTALPSRASTPVNVQCVTCHRGLSRPTTIEGLLAATIEKSGVDSAVRQYRTLRERNALTGQFDFTEWRINELARHLMTDGKTAEAIAMLEMNAEFNPQSTSIDTMLGELHRQRGERDKAIQSYQKALQKDPRNQQARQRLTELGAPPPP